MSLTATRKPIEIRTGQAKVYCPICTHTVEVTARANGAQAKVVAGQRCPRCSGSIDAGIVVLFPQAA